VVQAYHVLPKHPETGRLATKDETYNVIQVERRRGDLEGELFVIFLLIKKFNFFGAQSSFPH
jgi:hypothetical protein